MSQSIRRLGVLGGSFDPPHLSHLAIAQAAREQAALDRVLLLPNGDPPHKRIDVPAAARYEMARLAAATVPGVAVCDIETRNPETSYTHQTLGLLQRRHPHSQLVFLMGADQLTSLPYWRGAQEIFRLAELLVLPRQGHPLPADALERLRRAGARISLLPLAVPPLSSTLVRQRLLAAQPVSELVPEPVERYVYQHGLYLPPELQQAHRALRERLEPAEFERRMDSLRQAIARCEQTGQDAASLRQNVLEGKEALCRLS